MRLRVLDLFHGLGGFSQAFRDRGHWVVGVDLIPPASVLGKVEQLPVRGEWDVVLASPPCTEFTREFLPWRRTGKAPDLSLVEATMEAVRELRPRYWVLENVVGAARWLNPVLGKYSAHLGSRYLWGEFPPLPFVAHSRCWGKWWLSPSKDRARLRACIPYPVSLALCLAMERPYTLFP